MRLATMFCLGALGAAVACGGCGAPAGASPQAPAPERANDVDELGPEGPDDRGSAAPEPEPRERVVRLLGHLAETMRGLGGDCRGFNQRLGMWLTEHGDVLRDILIMDLPDSDHEIIDEKINEVATEVVFVASECGDDETAMTHYNEFDALVL